MSPAKTSFTMPRGAAARNLWVIMNLVVMTSCKWEKTTGNTLEQESYPVTSPVVMDVPHDQEYVTDIQSSNQIELRARLKGFLEKIPVDEGQRVSKGQVIFKISSHEYQEQLKRVKARLKSITSDATIAEIELRNARLLVEKNIISNTEMDLAQAKLDSAQARVEEARADVADAELKIDYAEVRAPFDGIINRIRTKAGSLVEEGDLLTTLSNDGDVYAYFNVSENEYLELAKRKNLLGQNTLALELANGQVYPHKGRIETWENVFSKSTGSIAFRARFPNPEHLLKHGSSGKVIVQSQMENALVIPQKCTFEVQHKLCVFLVGSDNTVQMRYIVPHLRLPNHYVIESGLSPDDRIVYEGIQVVKEGEAVNADFKPLNEVAPLLAKL